ncbi:MAG: hypothetical protein QOF87_1323 [Pseudonocardiales bacterium]|nr:hypothetical protein [Pseudonocardiales bacterium]
MRKRFRTKIAVSGGALLMLALGLVAFQSSSAAASPGGGVRPHPTSEMDCNGHSPVYKSVKPGLGGLCTDPVRVEKNGDKYRFNDNGVYIGHDEPSVKFISSEPGSANDVTYHMRLAVDPQQRPTVRSARVTKYAELSIAPWFGLPMCDPKSFPINPCEPDSDANDPNVAGSAFMELQFYAPGFTPFVDGPSCDQKKYCAALTIDSLECDSTGTCNNNCIEPVNFAFLQRNGVPAGPPSPQLSDLATFTPNRQTLMMNPGDQLVVRMHDTGGGFLTRVDDLSTGQTGYMVASARNRFMNTNMSDCSGTPFSFHPEYSSARQENQVPWAALEGGVLMQTEIGHFEPCSSVTNDFPVDLTSPDGSSFSDPRVFQTCVGGLEPGSSGEGPCDLTTGLCQNATTQNGAPCPTNAFASNANCEFSDAACMPAGARNATANGQHVVYRWPIAGCLDNVFQNGDLDFDGTSYKHGWPDGSKGHPTAFEYSGPVTRHGHTYPTIQFETNVGASEFLCNTETGAGCTVPPTGAQFYPFWTLGKSSARGHVCAWNFGDVIPGSTVRSFGRTAEYGTPDVARFGGTSTSSPRPNPQLSTRC